MPLPPSNYSNSYDYTSQSYNNPKSSLEEMEGSYYRSSYPNSSTSLNYKSYPTSSSIYSSTSSVPYSRISPIGAEYRPLNHLPPSIPSRRITSVKRSYLNNLEEDVMERMPMQRRPVLFQTRPLKNLTVLSHSDTKTPIRSVTRSPSPAPSIKSSTSTTPRRTFPQVTTKANLNLDELSTKEESPVVFDANLTFVLGTKGKMKQNFVPIPAHLEDSTASSYLTNKISDFLKRTDHVMDEWKSMGRRRNDDDVYGSLRQNCKGRKSLGRSSSATNIMIKGFQLFSRANSCSRSSMAREISEDRTDADGEEVFLFICLLNYCQYFSSKSICFVTFHLVSFLKNTLLENSHFIFFLFLIVFKYYSQITST